MIYWIRIFVINLCIFFYTIAVLFHYLKPQGIIHNIYLNYKNINNIRKNQYKLNEKLLFLQNIKNSYKNKDMDIIGYLLLLKFNIIPNNYSKILWIDLKNNSKLINNENKINKN